MLKKERDKLIKSFRIIEDMCRVFGDPQEPPLKKPYEVFRLLAETAKEPREWLENYMPKDRRICTKCGEKIEFIKNNYHRTKKGYHHFSCPKKNRTEETLIKRCRDWIDKLCATGGRAWSLQVPPNPDVDPDLLFSELIDRYEMVRSIKEKR